MEEWLEGFAKYQALIGVDSRAETFPPIMGVLEPTNPHSFCPRPPGAVKRP
jgi:hypothetical protein